jgi:predicted nucleic acid-binding protein
LIVSDTNLMIRLYVESAISPLARELMLRDPDWAAPVLWRSEFRSTLIKGIRSKLMGLDDALRIISEAESMMSFNEHEVASDDVLELAALSGCSAYDAEFVVLARDLRVPLVTTDRELLEKFPETALTPERFLAFKG